MAALWRETKRLKTILHAILLLGGVSMILPFLWMFSTSLKPLSEVFLTPPTFIPSEVRWENYAGISEYMNVLRQYFNTFVIVFSRLGGEIFVSAFVAYGFARLEIPGKRYLFLLLLALMMMPYEVTMIPTYLVWSRLGLVDNYLPLIIPSWTGSATFIFFLRMYFLTFPRDMQESAYIDGANNAQIFIRIFIPIAKPALITIGLWSFMGTWNDLLGQLIYINSADLFTVQLGLASFSSITGSQTPYNILMAASLVVLMPVIVIFIAAQKYFVEGIKMTGIKG